MAANQSNPLNDQHCACLDAVIESTAHTAELIRKCRECGIDVAKAEQVNNAQRDFAMKAKGQFFPERV